MATYGTTTHYGFRKLLGGNLVSDIDLGFASLADDIDAKIATADKGALSGRPVSSATVPGINGRLYYATDTAQLFYDMGAGWLELATVEAWQTVTVLINGWTADATSPPRYRRIGRTVRMMGQVANAGSGGAAFTLPAGYIPSKALTVGGTNSATSPPSFMPISINAGGLVGPYATSTAMRFDGISFTLD